MNLNLIFAYGSLINAESRAKDGMSGEGNPVKVVGIRRGWNQAISNPRVTALGVSENADSWCNGILVPLTKSELSGFDKREGAGGYKRIRLEEGRIISLQKEFSGEKIWVYIGEDSDPAASDAPIIQSYIDVIMSGCLSFGENFTKKFVISTHNWDMPWIDDRLDPIYPRAMKEVPLAETIDKILREEIPIQFSPRRKRD